MPPICIQAGSDARIFRHSGLDKYPVGVYDEIGPGWGIIILKEESG